MSGDSSNRTGTLRQNLDHTPQALRFGTSGRRGEVVHLSQLEVYLNVRAELDYLQSLSAEEGGVVAGDEFYFAYDLRPSSSRFVPEQQGRGELAQAVERALRDAGMRPVNLGRIPTPALTSYALERGKGSLMITGSHIPFDRNGYKTNSAQGELRKQDEAPVNARVALIRQQLYDQPYADSLFDPHGRFKAGSQPLGPERADARTAYVRRYVDFFGRPRLAGQRLLVYEHSAVGRDILVEILERLGARVIAAGRSETFVPIDTENIDEEQLTAIQHLAADAWRRHGPLDAVVSTDGDSDRPLILGVEPAAGGAHPQATRPPNAPPRGGDAAAPCRVRFAGGDLVGMVVAEYLGADAVVVPINCNDAIDRGPLKDRVEPKTRIGSPYVTAGMAQARRQGRRAVCGWEANGGFLTASDFRRGTRILKALPTRDAMLPILGVLSAMREGRLSLAELLARLPQRFSRAGLLRNFPRAVSGRILQRFAPDDEAVVEASFEGDRVIVRGQEGQEWPSSQTRQKSLGRARAGLSEFFGPGLGFGAITRLNYLDGVRIWFSNGDVAHLRPSGNADELRIYAVADTQARADAIVSAGIAEPEGILRRLERASVSRPPR